MKIINENVKNIYEIKKSKFITYLYKVNDLDEVNNILSNLRNEYNDATHICYAYKLNGQVKCSDDNEPSGTAGIPILEVLNKNDLDYILAVVIRYFGGIKLGAGGLVRSYSNSIIEALKLIEIVNLVPGYKLIIETDYSNTKKLDYILKDELIIDKQFNDKVKYIIEIDKEKINNLSEFNYIIEKEIMIQEKKS